MKKVMGFVVTCLMMLISAQAQAQVIRAGQTYYGGATLELAGSGATFVVPTGWSGQYNQREKLFDMYGPAGESLSVGYEGESYADALAFAKKPITTSEGIVMTPVNSEKIKSDRFFGEAVAYKGTALFIPVGGVSMILKTPANKGLTISAAGLGNNFNTFTNQIGLVAPSLLFRAHEQKLKEKLQAKANKLAKQLVKMKNRTLKQSNSSTLGASKTPPAFGKERGSIKLSKGNPFKKGHGMRSLPAYRDHSRHDLYLRESDARYYGAAYYKAEKSSGHSKLLNVFQFMNDQSRVTFCPENDTNKYKGTYIVDEFIEDNHGMGWVSTGKGRYQLYSTKPSDSWPSSYVKQPADIMFIDRADGSSQAIRVKTLKFSEGYWDGEMSFNGVKFIQKGISKKCPAESFGDLEMKQILLDASAAEIRSAPSSSSQGGSSGSYDTHFGTTDSGAIIFSSPSGSMCSGC